MTAIDAAAVPSPTRAHGGLLKTDTLGRVCASRERRQALLEEFDQSGVSAAQFARLAGIGYSTFAGWLQRRRRRKAGEGKERPTARSSPQPALHLVEALIDPVRAGRNTPDHGLVVHLPGGARLELSSPAHVPLVAALVQALQPLAARC